MIILFRAHYTFTYCNQSGLWTFYVNGSIVADRSGEYVGNNNTIFRIGQYGGDPINYFAWKYGMGEVVYASRLLSTNEISILVSVSKIYCQMVTNILGLYIL